MRELTPMAQLGKRTGTAMIGAGVLALTMMVGAAFGAQGHTVKLTVQGVRSGAGAVIASLCDKQIPICLTYRASAPAVTGETDLTFTGVLDGRYSLAAFHDENGDGQTQIPPEGFGFGNNAAYPPTFDTAAINVTGDMSTMLTLTYFGSAAMEGAAPSGSSGAPAPAGVTRTDVRDGGLYGELYRPEGAKGALPAVILLGGSEGGIDVISAMAPSFAKQGFATLALAYWGEKGLPQTLENIPLEYFDAAATWLQTQPGVDADAIGVLGWSRGSEAAMLLGTRNPKIHAVAAVAPSGIVWSGINYGAGKPKSAWTAGGEGLPYMNPDASAYDPKGTLAPMFLKALPQAQSHPQAAIPVEKIGGPILLISGTDDGIWPSATFAGRIAERLKAANFKYNVENLVYPDAGHAVFVGAPDSPMAAAVGMPNAAMGGSLQANQAAWEDNWPRTLAFFNAALKEKSQ